MKQFRLRDLDPDGGAHLLSGLLPGAYLSRGGIGFKAPGHRSHDHDGPGKSDRHIHADDHEAFLILQGRGTLEIDGEAVAVRAGDVLIVEPGEDHHLVSSREDPLVNLYLHAGATRHDLLET